MRYSVLIRASTYTLRIRSRGSACLYLYIYYRTTCPIASSEHARPIISYHLLVYAVSKNQGHDTCVKDAELDQLPRETKLTFLLFLYLCFEIFCFLFLFTLVIST